MPVTARFADGTAAVYNSVEEALDQAVWDEEHGFRKLDDVIEGAYDDHRNPEAETPEGKAPKQVAGRGDLQTHRKAWREQWAEVDGVLEHKDARTMDKDAAGAATKKAAKA